MTDFTNDSDFERALSGVSNLSVSTAALPEGWNSGAAWSFDITNGRLATIDLTFNKTLFGLPESLSFDLDDKDGVVKKVHFFYVDALGKQEMRNVDLADLNTAFADEPMEYYRYPLKLTTMRFTLDTKKRDETRTIALRNMATHYSAESGVETVVADKPSALGIALRGETVEVRYDSQCSEKARLSMFSATGQMIVANDVALQAGTNTLDIDAKSAGTGIYFVVLQSPSVRAVGKCVIR